MPAWAMPMSAQAGFFCSFSIFFIFICSSFYPTNKPPTLGTRGYIPDSSPRGCVGLVESCIVSPKIGITELALIYSLHGLNKYTTILDNILETFVGSMSRTDI